MSLNSNSKPGLASAWTSAVTAGDVRWCEAALLWGRGQEPRDGYDQAVFERLDAAVAVLT